MGPTPDTGRYAPETLRRQGHSVRSLVYKYEERAECLKGLGVEVVVGDPLNPEDVLCALAGIPPHSPSNPPIGPDWIGIASPKMRRSFEEVGSREAVQRTALRDNWWIRLKMH